MDCVRETTWTTCPLVARVVRETAVPPLPSVAVESPTAGGFRVAAVPLLLRTNLIYVYMFEEEGILPFETHKHYGSADISDIGKIARDENTEGRKIFEDELILPCYMREKRDDKVVGRDTFFRGMSDVEIREEIQVLSKCSKNDFYFLLKNEPHKYCSIVEQSPECGILANERFGFSISRVDDNTSSVSLSVKDEHPITLSSTDSELYDDLQQYINAKFKEAVFNLEHDKGCLLYTSRCV